MTNYCQSRIVISGSEVEMHAFAQDCLSMLGELHVFDFEKIRPMPASVKGLYRSVPSKLGGHFPDELSSGWVGMEALLRKRPPHYEGEIADADPILNRDADSILNRDVVKQAGIRNYDDLNDWLRRNDPDSLELGRKCLAAFEACGVFFEEDWITVRWGCEPHRVDYSCANLGETSYEAVLISPWSAPEGIFREVARRHPGLTSRFAALEEGNDYAFVLTTSDNKISEEWPAITDALIDEIEGAGGVKRRIEEERAFYEKPPVLRERPVRHVKYWLKDIGLRLALAGYPLYSPPHSGVEWTMPEQDARENFEFFLAQRAHRIEVLARFLARFGVSLDFSDRAKPALDRWLNSYGALLFVSETGVSFLTHQPEWSGPRLGLNVIFDIGIYLGEFAIAESPWLKWEMDVRTEPGRTRSDDRFQRPVIGSAKELFSFPRDIIRDSHNICHSLCEHSYMWKQPLYTYGSRPLARHFVTKTLRHVYLSARGDFKTANEEATADAFAR